MLYTKPRTKKKSFTEIVPDAKYVYIYRLYKGGKFDVLYDNSRGKMNKSIFLKGKDIHEISHKKAFQNQKIVYFWFLSGEKTSFYETTIIPLQKNWAQIESIICIVKQLQGFSDKENQDNIVADSVGESFTRILLEVREEEKRQIASAFHDEIGSNAVLLNSVISILKADLLEGKTDAAMKKVQELEDAIQKITKRMRKIIISVRPPQLKEVGLNSAIKDLIDSLKSTSKLKIQISCEINDKVKISEESKIVLYRCVQESINNVFKHAKAKNIKVSLKDAGASILLTVKDDGIGYEGKKSNSVKHMGLLGMSESVTCLGGTFDIKGKKGKGTVVNVRCPKISYIRKRV